MIILVNVMRKINCKLSILVISLLLLTGVTAVSQARQFRQVIPIPSPQKIEPVLPEGAEPVEQPRNISRERVREAVESVISQWNAGDLEEMLSEDFFDRSRLSDAVDTIVPRDASVRVQSIQGVQTLQQYQMESDEGGEQTVSIVSATVRTQLEFNDPQSGFVRRQGLNEFILKITQGAER